MSKLQKIGRFLECHSIGVFAVTMAMSVFLLFDPLGQRAWDTFFTNNEKVLEIYWQTLTLLLVILIPVTGAVIGKLDKKFPEFGARIFFQIVARVRQFWILIPFSFLLFFARVPVQNMPPEGISVNLEVLRIIHYLLFVLWCFLFWGFFEILRKSVALFVDLGDLQNEVFYRHLSEYSRQQKTMSDDENEGPAWKLLWDGIDVKNDKWHRKFLLLFWKRQEELIGNKQYLLATTLLESFSQRYLTFGDGQKQIDVARQMNARKRWLWFCEKQMNDKTENPYAIAIRLLDIHFSTWRNLEEIKNPGNGNNMDPKKRGRLSTLQRLVRSMLETLFRDELGKTDDYYDSFFRCLTGFFDTVAPDKSTLSPKKYQEYLESLPVYRPVFEAAYNSHLSNYEPHAEGSGFPNQWRVLEACLEQTNSIDSVQRRVWLEQFCTWSRDHIDHGKKEWDNALDGALKMLFPEAYAPWMAFAFAYRALAFGKSQIAGLCSWNRNFGYDSLLIDMSDMPEEGWEQKHDERMMKVTRERQTIAVTIIQKFRFFGKPGQITNLIAELESLSGTLSGDSESENNRREILEMLQEIAKSSP